MVFTTLAHKTFSELMIHHRRRGTAILETSKGILVVSGKSKLFLLPGGGASKWESRRKAAIRELREETGLIAIESKYLFSFRGRIHEDFRGGYFRDCHKVFLIKANGESIPKHEIKYVDYWHPDAKIKISNATKEITINICKNTLIYQKIFKLLRQLFIQLSFLQNMAKLSDKCSKCGNIKSQEFWDFDNGSVLCDSCNKKYGLEWEKKVQKKNSSQIKFSNKVPAGEFVLTSIFTLGFYQLVWFYRNWKYFKEKEKSDIWPFWRAFFAVFFIYSLFKKISQNAKKHGCNASYSSGWNTFWWIFLRYIGVFAFVPILSPLEAANFYYEKTEKNTISRPWRWWHIVLIVILWILILTNLFSGTNDEIPESIDVECNNYCLEVNNAVGYNIYASSFLINSYTCECVDNLNDVIQQTELMDYT